jgi:hypothetical protein
MRPADAHRVTVFGSTLNMAATSPGVSNRSGISMVTGHSCFAWMAALSGLMSIVPYQSVMSVSTTRVHGGIPRSRQDQTPASTMPRGSDGSRPHVVGNGAARMGVLLSERADVEQW